MIVHVNARGIMKKDADAPGLATVACKGLGDGVTLTRQGKTITQACGGVVQRVHHFPTVRAAKEHMNNA